MPVYWPLTMVTSFNKIIDLVVRAWANNYISPIYVTVVNYLHHNLDVGLINICKLELIHLYFVN